MLRKDFKMSNQQVKSGFWQVDSFEGGFGGEDFFIRSLKINED